jgi:hypothetical protein
VTYSIILFYHYYNAKEHAVSLLDELKAKLYNVPCGIGDGDGGGVNPPHPNSAAVSTLVIVDTPKFSTTV